MTALRRRQQSIAKPFVPTVPAKQLEAVLKRHLKVVEHVMVVGSNKGFLSCILALKTKGSEAEA
jgi:hypothetical protein